MPTSHERILNRDARLAAHAREGFRLAASEPEYRSLVLARLKGKLAQEPNDLWDAIAWTWAVALGAEPPSTGAVAHLIVDASASLTEWLCSDDPLSALDQRWEPLTFLSAGSTVRSHPFADLRSWSIRPKFAASSSTPHGS